jgi:hypothetical protein
MINIGDIKNEVYFCVYLRVISKCRDKYIATTEGKTCEAVRAGDKKLKL